jgi:hypothetical protein
MISAFIPKNLLCTDQKGKTRKVYFVEVKRYSHRPDIALDMYYESHRAAHQWTTEAELAKIDKAEESAEIIPLFEKAMKTTPRTRD